MAKRADEGPPFVVLVDKPAGPTSHDLVRFVRRVTGRRRAGQCGTLDPFATGLLVVIGCVAGPRGLRLAPEPVYYTHL